MKRLIALVLIALALVMGGCSGDARPRQVDAATYICQNNGGWANMNVGGAFWTAAFDVTCRDGSEYEVSYSVDGRKGGQYYWIDGDRTGKSKAVNHILGGSDKAYK